MPDAGEKNDLKLLITAAEAFPAMEELVLGAEKQLSISLHHFQPSTRCRSAPAIERGLEDWSSLLKDAALRGVDIRLLLNDFDPVGAAGEHRLVWSRIRELCKTFTGEGDPELCDRLQIQIAHPGGSSGWAVTTAFWPLIRNRLRIILKERDRHKDMPGLRELLGDKETPRLWPPKLPMVQSFHQKFLIADTRRAIIGGLDIDERRYDSSKHDQAAEQTWQDISVDVEGPVVGDIERHFGFCWNEALKDGVSHAPAFLEDQDNKVWSSLFGAQKVQNATEPEDQIDVSDSRVSFVATYGKPLKRGALHFGPVPHEKGIENAYLDVIENAKDYIYVETQFLRSTPLRRALVAASRRPDLHLIALLPGAPDVVAFEGDRSWPHRYGEALQVKSISALRKAFGPRFYAFSKTSPRQRTERSERDALHGKGMVYIHSKVLIADDEVAIVSSANMNGRSMRWDYEAGLMIMDRDLVSNWRKRLFSAHLSFASEAEIERADNGRDMLALWMDHSKRRAELAEDAEKSGIVPYPARRASRFSRVFPIVPENMV